MPYEQDRAPDQDVLFELSPEHEATLRTLAQNALRQSFEVLAEERVIPRSQHRPWIRVGRDYFGHAVERDGPLSKALEAALPDRFDRSTLDATVDYPWWYSRALLEAAVASATIADEPYDISSPSVQGVVDEFIEKLQAQPATISLQVVTDIDLVGEQDGETKSAPPGTILRVAGVDIIRVGEEAEFYVEQELRSAGDDVEREDVISWPGPEALLVARVAKAVNFDARLQEARRRLRNVVTAIRLATGASVSPLVTIYGEPGNVPAMHPQFQPHISRFMRLANRPVALGAGDVAGLEALSSRVDEWFGGDDLEANPLLIATGRLNRSMDGSSVAVADVLIDLSVGLEAALSGTDSSDVSLRLRLRAADLLTTPDDPGDRIYKDVKELYRLRSGIIHGTGVTGAEVKKSINRVSSTSRSSLPGEQLELALDRWRDLLRRAILARAALATEDSLWPLKNSVDVDGELRTESRRAAWLAYSRRYWTDLGLASALDPIGLLQLTLTPEADGTADDDSAS